MARLAAKESLVPNPELEKHTKLMEVLRQQLPQLCKELEVHAARQLKRMDSLLRDRKHLTLEEIADFSLELNSADLSERCDQFLERLAAAGVLDTATFPTLFFELRNNTPFAKDNTTIIRVYQELLEAYRRRSDKTVGQPELLAIY